MIRRAHLELSGIVQGVGMRPYVFRLAEERGLVGWVYNHASGLTVEAEGEAEEVADFIAVLREQPPSLAVIQSLEVRMLPPLGTEGSFIIRSSRGGQRETLISPDMATCDDCLAELWDPANRRFRYAFTNCTNCGPRFTIIRSLPYDRPRTTMSGFPLCADCEREYTDPRDRRFHAQPVACPACGPRLRFCDGKGRETDTQTDPLQLAQLALSRGEILAVKGLGGFHLCCDAENERAVAALRRRKLRWDRPFALMMPDLETVRSFCGLSEQEQDLLTSRRRPIVLLQRRAGGRPLPEAVAPGNRRLGVMLPYTPLHHLLMEGWSALVMTSGNLSDEPIVYEDEEAFSRLQGLADGFLTHDRPIFRRCDDSVAVVAAGAPRLIRRSRGYAPEPLPIDDCGLSILACGGQQKNTFCLTRGGQAFLSQHIGDLDNRPTLQSFEREISYFQEMFNTVPQVVVADKHPDYLAAGFARQHPCGRKLFVQHHHAHLASVLAEHGIYDRPVLGLIFDGSGWGEDGTVWGGEVLIGDCSQVRRAAHLLPLPLPGGEQAIREPWRQALAALEVAWAGAELPEKITATFPAHWPLLRKALRAGVNSPLSSGMGRLFDAVACLSGLNRYVSYEGQAAIELEQVLAEDESSYRLDICGPPQELIIDWRGLVREAVADRLQEVPAGVISARFHAAVADVCLRLAERLGPASGLREVVLSGGCWQNVRLLETVTRRLQDRGFTVLTNERVPVNDGGLSLGQAAVAAALVKKGRL